MPGPVIDPVASNYNKGADIDHRSYNHMQTGTDMGESDIGTQFNDFYYQKKALIELKKEQYFSQMADVTAMPKHFGKKIKKYHYLPLLDDRNVNDQGIDATGVRWADMPSGMENVYWSVRHSTIDNPEKPGEKMEIARVSAETATHPFADAAAVKLHLQQNFPDGIVYNGEMEPDYNVATSAIQAASGNLYGSSKDIGTITAKLPVLSEHGGRVNRVGFRRMELEGAIEKFGFFDEYTQESMDFDTDSELMMHINREMLRGANEITEDSIQIDLLNGAGVVRYPNGKQTMAGIAEGDYIDYEDLMRLSIDLDNNRCPKNTKIITGSRMIDTRTIDGARYMYIGSELIPMVKGMVDQFGNPAFIPVHQYGAATTLATGEIGSIDQFRIIVVPEMMKHADGGTGAPGNDYGTTAPDVFPMLVVGDGSFTTIGFQTNGKTVKFKITHKKPGQAVADRDDPYGEVGFMSIKWYYGMMILRPERLAVCWTAAPLYITVAP